MSNEFRDKTWVVVPCKGRLAFLKQTAPRVLQDPHVNYCLVDYSCPERSGSWLLNHFSALARERRLVVEHARERPHFSKSAAHNLGARRAIAEGARYLVFLDADTLIEPGFLPAVYERQRPKQFLIAGLKPDGRDDNQLIGVLGVPAEDFRASAGFEERFVGWGCEDIEFRLRLHVIHGLGFADVPIQLLAAIRHDDALRNQYQAERNVRVTQRQNLERLRNIMFREWRGQHQRSWFSANRLWVQWSPSRNPRPRQIEPLAEEALQPAVERDRTPRETPSRLELVGGLKRSWLSR